MGLGALCKLILFKESEGDKMLLKVSLFYLAYLFLSLYPFLYFFLKFKIVFLLLETNNTVCAL